MKAQVIQAAAHGGPEVLHVAEVELAPLAAHEARLQQTAVGLNFIDVYYRTGLYPGPPPPFVLGVEACGVVQELGPAVTDLRVGQRVAYAGELGAYASARNVDAARLVGVPDSVSDEAAAGVTLKGLTAWYLVRACRPLLGGEWVLIHAAAGGVGQVLCRWAASLGARVIGTVGSEPKAELARASGCEVVLRYDHGDWPAAVREATDGVGVEVAYDSVGAATFEGTLECMATRGTFVSFGNASGPAPAVEPFELMRRGSLVFTRPTLKDFVATRADLLAAASELFGLVGDGALPVSVGLRLPLCEAAQAHRRLEARETSGSTVLLP